MDAVSTLKPFSQQNFVVRLKPTVLLGTTNFNKVYDQQVFLQVYVKFLQES